MSKKIVLSFLLLLILLIGCKQKEEAKIEKPLEFINQKSYLLDKNELIINLINNKSSAPIECLVQKTEGDSFKDCSNLEGDFSLNKGVLKWNTTYKENGVYEFKVKIKGTEKEESFKISVNNSNRAPILNEIKDIAVNIDENIPEINLEKLSKDQDGDDLIYSCFYEEENTEVINRDNDCSKLGIVLSNDLKKINWSLKRKDLGKHRIVVVVSDGSNERNVKFHIDVIDPKAMITQWNMTSDNKVLKFPIDPGYSDSSFMINWGDSDKYESFTGKEISHTYEMPGVYEVKVSGTLKAFSLRNASFENERKSLIKVISLGDVNLLSMSHAFYYAVNLNYFKGGNVSRVSVFDFAFSGTKSLKTVDLSTLDTSNATNLSSMFASSDIEELDLSSLDTRKVQSFNYMFYNAKKLKKLNLKGVNTSAATSMSSMFGGLVSLDELDLSSFDTSNVKTMTSMFSEVKNLKTINLKSFNTKNVNDFSAMFYNSLFEKLDLSSFNTQKATSLRAMFAGTKNLQELNISSFQTSNVENFASMFYQIGLNSLDLSHFDTSSATTMMEMFASTKFKRLNLSNFDTRNVTSLYATFHNMKELEELDLSTFDTSSVTKMNGMFKGTSALRKLNISNFDTRKVDDFESIFENSGIENLLLYGKTKADENVDSWIIQSGAILKNAWNRNSFNNLPMIFNIYCGEESLLGKTCLSPELYEY